MNCKKTEKCCLFFSGIAALLLNLVELSPVFHLMTMEAEFLTQLAAPTLPGHPVLPESPSVFKGESKEVGSVQPVPVKLVCAMYC